MADDNVEQWIKNAEGKRFVEVVMDINAKIHDLLEYKSSRGNKISMPTVNCVKKALDFILKQCTEISEDNKVMKARLDDRAEYNAMMSDLAQKISRTSVSSIEEVQTKPKEVLQKRRDEHTVIVTPNEENQDVSQLREKIKLVNKRNKDLPLPKDIITTKTNRVILKYKTKAEVDVIRDSLADSEEIKDIAKINVPIRRRERILILSVDPELKEEEVKQEVEKCLQDGSSEDTMMGLKRKLQSSDIDSTTKTIIESLMKGTDREVRIIRKIETKQRKNNWLIDVDEECKNILLKMKRICIDFERYRVVEFVSITRCFKCQRFGHMSNSCTERVNCVKCAADHYLKDCKSDTLCCSNCYFDDVNGDCSHRADSSNCPAFQKYRLSIVANRS